MNNATLPEISVVMPVYNAEKYLNEAIDSVLNQTYSSFELIILNDNSSDTSKAIIESYLAKDSRIFFIDKETNVGPANLRNEGFELARGTFIALLDADDIAKPTRFEKQIAVLNNNPEIGVCGSWFTSFGEKVPNKIIKHPDAHDQIKVNFLIDCTLGNSTAFFRKKFLGDVRYDSEYVPVEDYHLWSRLIVKTQFHIIQESLVNYRIHDTNISQTKIENVKKSNRRIKIELLKQFDIEETNPNIDAFINLIEGQKGLTFIEIKAVCECDTFLKNQNKKLGNFNADLLEKMLLKSLKRIVRKAKKQNFTQLNYIKKNQKKLYQSINILDKIALNIKAILA